MVVAYIFKIILFIFLMQAIGGKIKKNYYLWFFVALYLILFDLVPLLLIILEVDDLYFISHHIDLNDTNLLTNYMIFNFLYLVLVYVGYFIGKRIPKITIRRKKNNKTSLGLTSGEWDFLLLISSILSVVGIIGMIFFTGVSLNELFRQARFSYWQTRNTYGLLLSSYFAAMVLNTAFIFSYTDRRRKLIPIISVIFVSLVYLFVFRSRTIVMGIGLALLLGFVINPEKRNHNIRIIKKAIIPVSLIAFLSIIWQSVRYRIHQIGSTQELVALIFSDIPNALKHSLVNGDLSYFYKMSLLSMELIPSSHNYLFGTTYLRLLMLPLPHSIIGNLKPEETQRVFAKIVDLEAYMRGATFPPSMLGDAYINFGLFGILTGLLVGLIIARMQYSISNDKFSTWSIAIASTGSVFLLLLIRGTFNGLFTLVSNYLIMVTFLKFYRIIKRHRKYKF